ncbi:MAG: YciC family protein [Acidobacteriaceae bacterium]
MFLRIYGRYLAYLAVLSLIVLGIFFALSPYIQTFGRTEANYTPQFSGWNVSAEIIYILTIVIGALLFAFLNLWLQTTLIAAVKNRNQAETAKSLYQQTKKLVGPYFWISFLEGLLIGIGFVLFIIPGIIFMIFYAFSGYVLVGEGERGFKALKKSKEYVKGHWWGVAGRVLGVVILVLIVVYLPAFIIAGGIHDQKTQESVMGLVEFIIGLFICPFVICYIYMLYERLKGIKAQSPSRSEIISPSQALA